MHLDVSCTVQLSYRMGPSNGPGLVDKSELESPLVFNYMCLMHTSWFGLLCLQAR